MPKFDNFSERTLQAITLAGEESRRLGHNFIGSEQLLIGLLSTDNGASQLLNAAGVTKDEAQVGIERIIGRGSGFVAIEMPFTPRARRAIEAATNVAREHGLMFVEPEHLLLTIVDLGEGISLKLLEYLDVCVPQLREAILAQIQGLPPQPVQRQVAVSGTESSLLPAIPSVSNTAPNHLSVSVLPQETGRWVAKVCASSLLSGTSFSSIGYGETDFEAIAEALVSLARMYREYQV